MIAVFLKTIFGTLSGLFGGIYGYLIAAAVAASLAAFSTGYVVHKMDLSTLNGLKLADQMAETKAVQLAAKMTAASDKVSLDAAVAEAQAQQKIVTNTITITKEIPVYVTAKSDANCILPNGAIKLLDAAGLGADPATLSGAAGELNDAPSGISLSQAVALLAANLGNGNAEQLSVLQAWVRQQSAIKP